MPSESIPNVSFAAVRNFRFSREFSESAE